MIFSRFSLSSGALPVFAGLLLYNFFLALEPSLLSRISHAGMMMGEGVSPLSFANILFLANGLAVASALVFLWPTGALYGVRQVEHRQWGWLGANVLVSNVTTTGLLTAALALAPVGNVVLIFCLQVPFGAFIAWLVYGETASRQQVLAYVLIFMAAIVPLLIDDEIMAGHLWEWGDLLALAAVFFRVNGQFLSKKTSQGISPALAVFAAHCASMACFLGLALVFYGPTHLGEGLDGRVFWLIVIYALLILNGKRMMKYISFRHASRMGIIAVGASQPVMAMGLAAVLAHHPPSMAHFLGGALVAGAMLAAALGGSGVREKVSDAPDGATGAKSMRAPDPA